MKWKFIITLKMSKEITTFSDYEIGKRKIYNHKNSIF